MKLHNKLLMGCIALLIPMVSFSENVPIVSIGTIGQGTVNYSAGAAIAKNLLDSENIQARVQPNSGNEALLSSLDTNKIDFAITGSIHINKELKNIRVVASILPIKIAFYVKHDSDIESIADLKNLRIPYGFISMASTNNIVESLLANGGLDASEIKKVVVQNASTNINKFISGETDAVLLTLGAAAISEIEARVGKIRPLTVDNNEDKIKKLKTELPGIYITKEDKNYVITYDMVIMANKNVSDKMINLMLTSIYKNKQNLANSFKLFNKLDIHHMYNTEVPAKYHDAALKFYKQDAK